MHAADEALRGLLQAGPADLHLHSSASDGLRTPAEVAVEAVEAGLRVFSLTDHDTLAGLPEAAAAAAHATRRLPGVVFLPGIELSVQEDRELHLLGYFPHGGQEALEPYLVLQRERRVRRNEAMVGALRRLGVDISLEELEAEGDGVVGRQHAARLLVRKGVVGSVPEAFDRYLAEGRPGYVGRERPDAAAGCAAIRAAGGVPVLAHPALYGWLDDPARDGGLPAALVRNLADLKAKGLGGVETRHGEAVGRQIVAVAAAARRVGLLETRGSDCHGEPRHAGRAAMYRASRARAWPEGTPRRTTLRVAAAVAFRTGAGGRPEVLVARRSGERSQAGLWEFPGGKMALEETAAAALEREIREELGCGARIGPRLCVVEHAYPDVTVRLHCHAARLPRASGFRLCAHSETRWVPVDALADLPLCPADYPVADRLASLSTVPEIE